MTISVGFRAPSIHELINGVVTEALTSTDESARYSDPDLTPQLPGEITAKSIDKIRGYISEQILSEERIADWLGRFVSETYPDVKLARSRKTPSIAAIRKQLRQAELLVRAEGARIAFIRGKGRGEVTLFADSERFNLRGKAAQLGIQLANQISVPIKGIAPLLKDKAALQLFAQLLQRGVVVCD
jgi:50S ribosomal protein L16 3-hydroxylase